MSSASHNAMGEVKDADAAITAVVSKHEIKHAALVELHKKHKENKVHQFKDSKSYPIRSNLTQPTT